MRSFISNDVFDNGNGSYALLGAHGSTPLMMMRRIALDWTLSRRQRVDFGAPPQTWEQYSEKGRIWDLYIDRG